MRWSSKRPIAWLVATLGVALLGAGCETSPRLVSAAKAKQIRVLVQEPTLTHKDADCERHFPYWKATLPLVVKQTLQDTGFTVVTRPEEPHELDAAISAHFTYCKKSGTCVNGSARVSLHQGNNVIEQHEFDTGSAACSSAPTIEEFSEELVAQLGDDLTGSEGIASFNPHAAVAPPPAQEPPPALPKAAPVAAAPAPVATPAPVAAAPSSYALGAPQPNAVALVIGIEKYRDVPPPDGARADANEFAALAQKTLGLQPENVRVLIDERATRGDIEKEIAWVTNNVPAGGRIYLFYSGHGAPDAVKGTPYLLPYDGDPSALDQTALRLAAITERLSKSRAAETLVFIDSCFSGAGGRSVLPPGTRPLVRVQAAKTGSNVAILSSSTGSEISGPASEGGGGLFTKFLLDALGHGEGDLDGDRQITLGELKAWIAPRVVREAQRQNRSQTPTLLFEGRDVSSTVVAFGVQRK
jgi:Caspase domain